MATVLDRLPRGSAAAIVRLRSLGDCVLTTPALDLLARTRPDLRIAVVVEERFREVFDGWETLPPDARAIRRLRPALCLNLHGGTRSAWLTALSGAPLRAGFGHFRAPFVYNIRIPRAQRILGVERSVHTAEHIASAMFFFGVPPAEVPRARLSAAATRVAVRATYAAIHPFASAPDKTWPAERFAAVAAHLAEAAIEPVFVGSAADDFAPFSRFRVVRGAPLPELKALIAGAALFLGNDSGPAHIAAAFGVPAVVLFGASDPAIWGPWRTASEILTSPGGIGAIEPERVLEALVRLRVHA